MSKKMLQAAAGNAGTPLYAEDVFSTYLYDGDSSNPITINNGIDFAGEGGLFWNRDRDSGTSGSVLLDTERGTLQTLATDQTSGNVSISSNKNVTYNSNGITIQAASSTATGVLNWSGNSLCSWSFRKAEKFFDVQTWTGNATAGREIAHNLGAVPGFIITKRTDGVDNWKCYHVGNPSPAKDHTIELDNANAAGNEAIWNDTAPTDTNFTVSAGGAINGNTFTYVAYLFASDAGGFGADGSESIIKCGSYTGNGAVDGPTVTLGFEPQWVMIRGTGGSDWTIFDNMRGLAVGGNDSRLWANQITAENTASPYIDLQPTGFKLQGSTGGAANGSGSNYIYMAIRRPMKTPESGTEVFDFISRTGTGAAATVASPILTDALLTVRPSAAEAKYFHDRLRGGLAYLNTTSNVAESSNAAAITEFGNDTIDLGGGLGSLNAVSTDYLYYLFQRAAGFMDVVAYSGSGTNPTNFNHNLDAIPELMIFKKRSAADRWEVYSAALGNTKRIDLNTDGAATTVSIWGGTPTATQFSLTDNPNVNQTGQTYIAYLFATLAGVSKVGSYTGTAASLNVDCGFSAGARFILIKRTDAVGDWYVWDSVRGIVAGNDPYLLLNSTAAEATATDYIDPLSSGFTVTSTAPAALNASGGTYIFLAIA